VPGGEDVAIGERLLELEVASQAPRDAEIVARVLIDLLHALDMSTTNAERCTRLAAIEGYYGPDLQRIAKRRG